MLLGPPTRESPGSKRSLRSILSNRKLTRRRSSLTSFLLRFISSRIFPMDLEQITGAAVVDFYERMSGGVALMDGKLIQRPVYIRAKRLISAAEFRHGEP